MVASPFTMAGELTRAAIQSQPEWLRAVPERVGDRRFPEGRVVFTGCGTSFHAAQTGGEAFQALEAVLAPPQADLLVAVSHEGETKLTLEAAQAFDGPVWLVTGTEKGPIAELATEVIVVTPAIEESYCHTASYTCAVAALAALVLIFRIPKAEEALEARPSFRAQLAELRHQQVFLSFATIALVMVGNLAWGTYQTAAMIEVVGINPEHVWIYLLVGGIGAVLGIYAGGRGTDWKPMRNRPPSMVTFGTVTSTFLPASCSGSWPTNRLVMPVLSPGCGAGFRTNFSASASPTALA